jgi:AcrR family transcriptional regulator
MMESTPATVPTRRKECAKATRRAVLDAARGLFSEQRYFSTKVDDIAMRARVSTPTIYAVSGSKQGLLNTLMDIWTRAPIVSTTLDRVDLDDPAAILRTVAATCRNMREEFGDIMRVLLATAPHDRPVAASLTDDWRILHALRDGMDVEQAVDVLWFYFGYSGLFTLRDENGWSYERGERWLGAQANWALLRNHPLC